MMSNTIVGCDKVEVLVIMVPSKKALELGESFLEEIKTSNSFEHLRSVIDSVFFKLYSCEGEDAAHLSIDDDAIEWMNSTVGYASHCLRLEIDNATILGQIKAGTRRETMAR